MTVKEIRIVSDKVEDSLEMNKDTGAVWHRKETM